MFSSIDGETAKGPAGQAPMRQAPRSQVLAALALGALAIGFAAPMFRLAAPIDPLLASAVRLTLAALLLAPSLPRARRAGRLSARTWRAAVLVGGLYALHFGAWVASLGMTSVAASVTLVTATPLMLAVIGWLRGLDVPSPRLWLGLALAGLGTLVLGGADASGGEGALVGDLLALLGAVAMAAVLLVVRSERTELEPLSFSSVAAGAGALWLAAAIAVRGVCLGDWPAAPSLPSLGWVAATAVISQLIGHTALTWAVSHASPALVALATTAEPVIATLVSFLWLDEHPAALVLVGSALTLLGVVTGMTAPATPAPSDAAHAPSTPAT